MNHIFKVYIIFQERTVSAIKLYFLIACKHIFLVMTKFLLCLIIFRKMREELTENSCSEE